VVPAHGYEDAVRNAISLGGDADTLACIAGAVAGSYYGVPPEIAAEARGAWTSGCGAWWRASASVSVVGRSRRGEQIVAGGRATTSDGAD